MYFLSDLCKRTGCASLWRCHSAPIAMIVDDDNRPIAVRFCLLYVYEADPNIVINYYVDGKRPVAYYDVNLSIFKSYYKARKNMASGVPWLMVEAESVFITMCEGSTLVLPRVTQTGEILDNTETGIFINYTHLVSEDDLGVTMSFVKRGNAFSKKYYISISPDGYMHKYPTWDALRSATYNTPADDNVINFIQVMLTNFAQSAVSSMIACNLADYAITAYRDGVAMQLGRNAFDNVVLPYGVSFIGALNNVMSISGSPVALIDVHSTDFDNDLEEINLSVGMIRYVSDFSGEDGGVSLLPATHYLNFVVSSEDPCMEEYFYDDTYNGIISPVAVELKAPFVTIDLVDWAYCANYEFVLPDTQLLIVNSGYENEFGNESAVCIQNRFAFCSDTVRRAAIISGCTGFLDLHRLKNCDIVDVLLDSAMYVDSSILLPNVDSIYIETKYSLYIPFTESNNAQYNSAGICHNTLINTSDHVNLVYSKLKTAPYREYKNNAWRYVHNYGANTIVTDGDVEVILQGSVDNINILGKWRKINATVNSCVRDTPTSQMTAGNVSADTASYFRFINVSNVNSLLLKFSSMDGPVILVIDNVDEIKLKFTGIMKHYSDDTFFIVVYHSDNEALVNRFAADISENYGIHTLTVPYTDKDKSFRIAGAMPDIVEMILQELDELDKDNILSLIKHFNAVSSEYSLSNDTFEYDLSDSMLAWYKEYLSAMELCPSWLAPSNIPSESDVLAHFDITNFDANKGVSASKSVQTLLNFFAYLTIVNSWINNFNLQLKYPLFRNRAYIRSEYSGYDIDNETYYTSYVYNGHMGEHGFSTPDMTSFDILKNEVYNMD